ncbi:hypothetical protein ACLM5H_21275, partial [Fredinandcohnia humi]
ELPSDSTSPWTPLLSAMYLPLPGRTRDFHPLEFAHAGRTKKHSALAECSKESKAIVSPAYTISI